ncbi:MAG TPA: hypothetical protein VGW34_13180 [Allosphingosinicella sp.]|nr:hypothetical protein [Allosphingosinicella sp.]
MPVYYFNVRGEAFDLPDLTGRQCRDEAAARAEAERLAGDIIANALVAGKLPVDATIEVDDEELRPIMALPVYEVRG